MNYKVTINQLQVEGNKLELAVSIEGPWNPRVRDPKLTVVFQNETQNRRLPLRIRSYEPQGDGTFYLVASYNYLIPFLFYQQSKNREFQFSFELIYGMEVAEHLPFTINLADEKAMPVLEQFMKDKALEYQQIEHSEDSEDIKEIQYDIREASDHRSIILTARPGQEEKFASHKIRGIVQKLVGVIWKFILLLVAIILLLFFFIESLLSLCGCMPRHKNIPNRGVIYILKYMRTKMEWFSGNRIGIFAAKLNGMNLVNWIANRLPVKKNRIAFLSNRRDDLSGNFEFVNNLLKENPKWDLRYVLDSRETKKMGFLNMMKMGWYFGNAKVVLIDDFSELFFKLPRRNGTSLIQLWHACGAFKTFGCSRLGRPGGQGQRSQNHRNYDYATVSSQNIARFYAEGFGVSLEKIAATGVPRTDVFFDKDYREKVTRAFYEQYPKLKEKKILLFAPTFRGNGKLSGYYPVDKLDVNQLYEDLHQEYAIIVKHHPFVQNRGPIKKEYRDYIIDLSENSELNDLLFVTDVLITDYSSVVFEASLLDIPILLYAFDLEEYISSRGFYFEFEEMAPGKILSTYQEIVETIASQDWQQDKLEQFKRYFFDHLDGKSSERTVQLIEQCMEK